MEEVWARERVRWLATLLEFELGALLEISLASQLEIVTACL